MIQSRNAAKEISQLNVNETSFNKTIGNKFKNSFKSILNEDVEFEEEDFLEKSDEMLTDNEQMKQELTNTFGAEGIKDFG